MAEDLARQRHLRRVLASPGKAYPELKDPDHKSRLTRYLKEETDQEGQTHHEHHNPAPQDGQTK